MIERRITDFGFTFGAAEVSRVGHGKGDVYMEIRTKREILDIRVTKGGRIIAAKGRV